MARIDQNAEARDRSKARAFNEPTTGTGDSAVWKFKLRSWPVLSYHRLDRSILNLCKLTVETLGSVKAVDHERHEQIHREEGANEDKDDEEC